VTPATPVDGLFEAHLTVADMKRSVEFYRDVVGLELAHEVAERGATFFWCGEPGSSMLGLWSTGSMPMGLCLHVAFAVSLEALLVAPAALRERGVQPLSFFGTPSGEPSVLGWMPAAAIYFRDPDGHQLEYLTMLDQPPRPGLGIVTWSEWTATPLPQPPATPLPQPPATGR
jgi:lactoylglutathione lyase